jgi:hypothetical protein
MGVVAEVYQVPDLSEALPLLDQIEGIAAWGRDGGLFRRTLVEIGNGYGQPAAAWAYVLPQVPEDASLIENGDWCRPVIEPQPLTFPLPMGPGQDSRMGPLVAKLLSRVVGVDPESRESEDMVLDVVEDEHGHDITTGFRNEPWQAVPVDAAPAAVVRLALDSLPGVELLSHSSSAEVRVRTVWDRGVDVDAWHEWRLWVPLAVAGVETTAEVRWSALDLRCGVPTLATVTINWGSTPVSQCTLESG